MTPPQPHPQKYVIDAEYIEKLDEWLSEHGIDELQRMQIRTRLKLDPIDGNPCDKCDHWDMCEGCPYTEERAHRSPSPQQPDRYIDESTETPCTPEGITLIRESAERAAHQPPGADAVLDALEAWRKKMGFEAATIAGSFIVVSSDRLGDKIAALRQQRGEHR